MLRLLLRAQENVLIGGQAVLEGVMMRSPNAYAVAVRRPDGEIVYMAGEVAAWTKRYRLLAIPVIRGIATLGQMLALGTRALDFSTDQALPDEQAKQKTDARENSGGWRLAASLLLAIGLAAVLFFMLPLAATEGLRHLWPAMGGGVLYNLVEGVIRLIIFLGYVVAISWIKDIKRLFQYHGAEHKVVHAFEAQRGMDVKTVQGYSCLHPRCGTSFLLFVMVVAIFVFSLLPEDWALWGKLASRLLLIPLIAGLSYELLRFSARFRGHWWGRALMTPGMWLQRLTTAPPDDEMVKVAIAAFEKAAEIEGGEQAVVL